MKDKKIVLKIQTQLLHFIYTLSCAVKVLYPFLTLSVKFQSIKIGYIL